jgi:hypothetical protein
MRYASIASFQPVSQNEGVNLWWGRRNCAKVSQCDEKNYKVEFLFTHHWFWTIYRSLKHSSIVLKLKKNIFTRQKYMIYSRTISFRKNFNPMCVLLCNCTVLTLDIVLNSTGWWDSDNETQTATPTFKERVSNFKKARYLVVCTLFIDFFWTRPLDDWSYHCSKILPLLLCAILCYK